MRNKLLLIAFILACTFSAMGQREVYSESAWGTFTQNQNFNIGDGAGCINCQSAPLIKGPAIITS